MVETSDADIPIIAGDDCIAMKSFTTDGGLELVCTSLETLKKSYKHLSEKAKQRTDIVHAKHPIFEGVTLS